MEKKNARRVVCEIVENESPTPRDFARANAFVFQTDVITAITIRENTLRPPHRLLSARDERIQTADARPAHRGERNLGAPGFFLALAAFPPAAAARRRARAARTVTAGGPYRARAVAHVALCAHRLVPERARGAVPGF